MKYIKILYMRAQVYIILIILSFNSISINGQNQDDTRFGYRNYFHLELGGTGGYYSLNYERNIINLNTFKTSGQIGFSFVPGGWYDISVPIGINEQFSFSNHHIEFGIGFVALREFRKDNGEDESRFWSDGITGRIGYRYQKPDGRFIFRIGFTPLLQRERSGLNYDPGAPFNVFTPWGGISIGYSL